MTEENTNPNQPEQKKSDNAENNEDTPDDGFITQTAGMSPDSDISPEKGDFEIGFEDGNGYIKIPIYTNNKIEKFTIPPEEVKSYRERRNELNPIPTVPDGVEREANFDPPGNFEGGEAVNTGGNIFCRIWRQEFVDNIIVEVIYGVPKKDGIGVNINNERGEFLGEVYVEQFNEHKHDEELQPHARELMKRINNGEFDEKIRKTIENNKSA